MEVVAVSKSQQRKKFMPLDWVNILNENLMAHIN